MNSFCLKFLPLSNFRSSQTLRPRLDRAPFFLVGSFLFVFRLICTQPRSRSLSRAAESLPPSGYGEIDVPTTSCNRDESDISKKTITSSQALSGEDAPIADLASSMSEVAGSIVIARGSSSSIVVASVVATNDGSKSPLTDTKKNEYDDDTKPDSVLPTAADDGATAELRRLPLQRPKQPHDTPRQSLPRSPTIRSENNPDKELASGGSSSSSSSSASSTSSSASPRSFKNQISSPSFSPLGLSRTTTTSPTLPKTTITKDNNTKLRNLNSFDNLPSMMKANQLTSLVQKNIPPQEQFHRSALLKTILASGNNNNEEAKTEMNGLYGKNGVMASSPSSAHLYISNNNNNTLTNNNTPLDLSIDAAIKEVVSRDEPRRDHHRSANVSLLPPNHFERPLAASLFSLVPSTKKPKYPVEPRETSSLTNPHESSHSSISQPRLNPSSLPPSAIAPSITIPSADSLSSSYHLASISPTSANETPREGAPCPAPLPMLEAKATALRTQDLSKTHPFLPVGAEGADSSTAVTIRRQRGNKPAENGRIRRKRQTLQEMARPLKEWMEAHLDNPYPSKQEKQYLAQTSSMTLVQVANWFANARRRLKIAEKRTGNDLAAKIAAISQADNHMEIEEMDDGIISDGEPELQIDLKTENSRTNDEVETHHGTSDASLTSAMENAASSQKHSILQRYLNELPQVTAGPLADLAGRRPATVVTSTNAVKSTKLSSVVSEPCLMTIAEVAGRHENATESPVHTSPLPSTNTSGNSEAVAGQTQGMSQYHHRRSPGAGSLSSHDYEDCGQASSETSSTSGQLDWTFNGSGNGEKDLGYRTSPSPRKSSVNFLEENLTLHDIEIDAALALVALSRMRQSEKLQQQIARSNFEQSNLKPLRLNNENQDTSGATIRVRQKY